MEKVLGFIKFRWRYILVAFIALVIGSSGSPSQDEVDASSAENDKLNEQIAKLESENKKSESKLKETEIKIEELEAKVKEAEPFFKLNEAERKEKEAELKAKETAAKAKKDAEEAAAKSKADAEAKAKADAEAKAQAEAQKLAEEKERKGYDTGITYDQLARTPDNYFAEKVKFRGTVIQVMEGDGITQIRFAVNDDYDTILLGEFDSSVVESRILEDDTITIRGLSMGLITYESTMGGQISIPGVTIENIEQ